MTHRKWLPEKGERKKAKENRLLFWRSQFFHHLLSIHDSKHEDEKLEEEEDEEIGRVRVKSTKASPHCCKVRLTPVQQKRRRLLLGLAMGERYCPNKKPKFSRLEGETLATASTMEQQRKKITYQID
ncbi:transposase IS3/IS911 family protein [Striga asiatica]|uniref:Transposase IS3/IS911 family protein n=1 Tax=Striga asiatica TaxID=4170 RepID=A0A5A7PP19_STRAF|nr:transposase IS3/IS911 family protein [Striga asiatica]